MVKNFLNAAGAGDVPLDVLLRDAPIMAHSIDGQGVLLNVSTFWAHRLGYEPPEMIGRPSIDFLLPSSRVEATNKHLPTFWKTGRLSNIRYKFEAKDGAIVPVILSAVALKGPGPIRSLAVLFDNGIAARMSEINDLIQTSAAEMKDIAANLSDVDQARLLSIAQALEDAPD